MITTNDIKPKERSDEDVKLTMVSSNDVKPKEFKIKGKPSKLNPHVISTNTLGEYQDARTKEKEIEDKETAKRQKAYDKLVAETQERQRLEDEQKEGSIETQIAALDKKRAVLMSRLRKKQ